MIEVDVPDDSAVAEARRKALEVGQAVGLDELRAGQLAIVATELSTNLVKHGGGGRLLVGSGEGHVDLLALDRGEGMADVTRCLADGFSSAGTPGNGLGAVRRLAQQFDIASWAGRGTVAFARVAQPGAPPAFDAVGAAAVALPGEAVSGDAWALHHDAGGFTVFMVDGLGHGSEAALAARAAVGQFYRNPGEPVSDIVHSVHSAIRHTRGGAVAVAHVEWAARTVVFAGLGNITGSLVAPGGQIRRMVSLSGTAGHNARKIQSFEYPCGDGLLIMHSDGLSAHWTLDPYPGFMRLHPALVAGLLWRDHRRARDDSTVVVARTSPP